MRRALLVDDDPDIRLIGSLSLERVGGWDVTEAASGAECLERAEKDIEVILLDVMMPGMDGPSTFEALLRDPDRSHIPVIFLTARVRQREIDGYLALGVKGVISKPFDPMELAAKVDELLAA